MRTAFTQPSMCRKRNSRKKTSLCWKAPRNRSRWSTKIQKFLLWSTNRTTMPTRGWRYKFCRTLVDMLTWITTCRCWLINIHDMLLQALFHFVSGLADAFTDKSEFGSPVQRAHTCRFKVFQENLDDRLTRYWHLLKRRYFVVNSLNDIGPRERSSE